MTDQPVSEPTVEQRHRDAAAKALGYHDWGEATDYRLTGAQDRQRDDLVQAFARFERDHLTRPPVVGGLSAEVEWALDELDGSDFSAVREHSATLRAALAMRPAPETTASDEPVAYRYAHREGTTRPLIATRLPDHVRDHPQDWIVEPVFANLPKPTEAASDDVVEAMGGVMELLAHLVSWSKKKPDDQPHFPNGMRPFSTGDLAHYIKSLTILANLPKPTVIEQATSPAPDAVLRAAIDLRDDLLNRAEWDGEAKVVVAGAGAWFRFNEAIDAALASSKPVGEGEEA